MKQFFEELFQYNHRFNNDLIGILSQQKTGHEACIRLMSHILNAHQIWNLRIIPGETAYTVWQVHSIDALKQINQKNFDQSIAILQTHELSNVIPYNTRGKLFEHSVRDILFQIINHSTYHKGQVATAFRKAGVEPVLTDYIYYKMM